MQNKEQPAPPEMTFKAVFLGLLLALVFGAANAYLGMKAGQTIAATIPAAVIAIAIFRVPALRGGVGGGSAGGRRHLHHSGVHDGGDRRQAAVAGSAGALLAVGDDSDGRRA